MFLSLCAEREFGQLGWNGSKKALSEEPERFDSFLMVLEPGWRDCGTCFSDLKARRF